MDTKKLKILSLSAVLAASLIGCSQTDSGTSGNTGNTANPGAPAGGGPGGQGQVDTTTGRVTDVAPLMVTDPVAGTNTKTADENVAELALAFQKTLTAEQQKKLQYDLTAKNAAVWSNLPTTMVQRNGLMLGTLSKESVEAFKKLAYAALGESGYALFKSLTFADEYLVTTTKNTMWDADLYYVAFLGEPSATGKWMLQIGGHHFASNMVFNGSKVSATPMFTAVEPQTFESNGTKYAPMNSRRDAMYTMINSLSAAQKKTAELSSKYDDVLVGPGKDGQFPSKSEGISYTDLNAEQKELVKKAITEWVKDVNEDVSKELLAAYLSEEALGETKIGWSGSTSYEDNGSYVRIDGPRVWIEFICQAGIADNTQIHFHTMWRDKEADYGGGIEAK